MFLNVYGIVLFVSTLAVATYALLDESPCSETNRECEGTDCGHGIHEGRCRKTRSARTCKFPAIPENTTYTTNIENAEFGQSHEFININVACKHGYGVDGLSEINCYRGHWWPTEQIPQCVPQCHLPEDPSVDYHCLVSGNVSGSRPCKEFEFSGTDVDPKCREPIYYSPVDLSYMRCRDGKWNYVAKCIPDCGTRIPIGTRLIIEGQQAQYAEVPWHAAIYRKETEPYEQICGGNIISNQIVLSAAHCFWNYDFNGQKYPADDFAVAVGKLYRPWNHPDDDAQESDVKEIHLSEYYQGIASNEQADLALIVVTKPFVYKAHIRPVCINFDANFQNNQLQPGRLGKVAGWGLTSPNGNSSDTLLVINLPFVDLAKCKADSPDRYRGYITGDKICAGNLNDDKVLCRGDSGGGLAFRAMDLRGTEKFFLRGIASSAPDIQNDTRCNPHTYITFTQLLPYQHFIKTHWIDNPSLNAPSQDHYLINTFENSVCVMPTHPAHGSYDSNIFNARPGDIYNYFVTLNVTCHYGYAIQGPNQFSCSKGQWWPSQQISTCVREAGWNWEDCKEEIVSNSRTLPGLELHPLSAAGGGNLRLSYRGDGIAYVLLSRERQLNKRNGTYFQIGISKNYADMLVGEAGAWNYIDGKAVKTPLSYSTDTPIAITRSDGTLKVHVGNASEPLFVSQDRRIYKMQYIGFDTRESSRGSATFKYGC